MALDTFFRYLGWLLQLTGLSLAALGLTLLRQKFDPRRPSVLRRAASALDRFLIRLRLRPPRPLTAVISSLDLRWAVQAPTPQLTLPPVPEDASTEDRIAELERQVRQLVKRDNDLAKALAKEEVDRRQGDSTVRNEGIEAIRQVDARIDELATGGLRLESIGLTCLFVGITVATVPDGVASVIRILTPLG